MFTLLVFPEFVIIIKLPGAIIWRIVVNVKVQFRIRSRIQNLEFRILQRVPDLSHNSNTGIFE
jgi:hypothetical protein